MGKTIYRGDAHSFPFTVKTDDGTGPVPRDVTGCTFRMTGKYSPDDADNIAAFTVLDAGFTRINEAQGAMSVKIPKTATESLTGYPIRLYCDIQITEPGGDPHTLWSQSIYVLPDISRTTP